MDFVQNRTCVIYEFNFKNTGRILVMLIAGHSCTLLFLITIYGRKYINIIIWRCDVSVGLFDSAVTCWLLHSHTIPSPLYPQHTLNMCLAEWYPGQNVICRVYFPTDIFIAAHCSSITSADHAMLSLGRRAISADDVRHSLGVWIVHCMCLCVCVRLRVSVKSNTSWRVRQR